MTKKIPALFVGHGNPMNALDEQNPFNQKFAEITQTFDKPKVILCISAHWYSEGLFIMGNPNPPMMYDFYGFPKALSEVQYPAKGSPELIAQVQELLAADVDPRPLTQLGDEVQLSSQGLNLRLYDVHPNPAPRDVGHGLRHAEPRDQDQLHSLLVGHRGGFLLRDEPPLHRLLFDLLGVDARTVVGHLDDDAAALLIGRDLQDSLLGLADGAPVLAPLEDRKAHV